MDSVNIQSKAESPGSRITSLCPYFHAGIELLGKRWTGAIVKVMMNGPLRFSEISQSIPDLSDRLLSIRMKELEQAGVVKRNVVDAGPIHVQYELTEMGRELEPILTTIETWAQRWLKVSAKDLS